MVRRIIEKHKYHLIKSHKDDKQTESCFVKMSSRKPEGLGDGEEGIIQFINRMKMKQLGYRDA